MTNSLLWSPKNNKNNLTNFTNQNSHFFNKKYYSLHEWSIKDKEKFWSQVWDFTKIKGIKKEPIIENEEDFINSTFFKNSTLNFTENLLSKNSNQEAIVFISEQNFERRITWKNLVTQVNQFSKYLESLNIKKGDRVAGLLPNIPESIISFLGTAKIGAIWSSCSADFGPKAIIDRFKQIEPKVLIISDEYFYNNKQIKTLNKIDEVLKEIPSIIKIVIVPYNHRKKSKYNESFSFILWNEILNRVYHKKKNIYIQYEFNIPLYILFSSGTTGIPKCIVHGAGGSLIQHKKEQQLHCDIHEGDKVFYFTTCGWMMWNWLISCLASKATIYLYDGSPFYPCTNTLFNIIENEKITFFGTGAKYLDHLKKNKINIKNKYKLDNLRMIASTGSPLVHETFDYVYNKVKKNIHLASISGGTDIVSCFVLGDPNIPVYSGEIQAKGLGMDVDVFDKKGTPVKETKGELVCKSPFPSKPIFFWKDKNNKNYFNTYFNKYNNIWHHGDYAEITKNKGFIIHGRSDATLNSGGIRIGTSELYRVIENIDQINECLATEYITKNDTKVVLFVKMQNKNKFNDNLKIKIKKQIKHLLSPKHIPAEIFCINDIPKTKSGKIVELMVKKIINKEKIKNLSSLMNPECIKEYERIAENLNFI